VGVVPTGEVPGTFDVPRFIGQPDWHLPATGCGHHRPNDRSIAAPYAGEQGVRDLLDQQMWRKQLGRWPTDASRILDT
jgi:hypothetical protein